MLLVAGALALADVGQSDHESRAAGDDSAAIVTDFLRTVQRGGTSYQTYLAPLIHIGDVEGLVPRRSADLIVVVREFRAGGHLTSFACDEPISDSVTCTLIYPSATAEGQSDSFRDRYTLQSGKIVAWTTLRDGSEGTAR
jgi:hypothetical protein